MEGGVPGREHLRVLHPKPSRRASSHRAPKPGRTGAGARVGRRTGAITFSIWKMRGSTTSTTGRGLPVEIKDTHAQAPSKTGTSSTTSDTEAGNVDISNSLPVSDSVSDTSRPSDTAPPDTAHHLIRQRPTQCRIQSAGSDQNPSDTASSTPFCKENQNVNGVLDVSDEDGVLDRGSRAWFSARSRWTLVYRQDGDGEARQ